MTFGYVVVPLFFSCVSAADPTAAFVTTGEKTVLTFGLTAAAAIAASGKKTIATIDTGLLEVVQGETPSATLTCADPVDVCAEVTVTPTFQTGDEVTLTYTVGNGKSIPINKVFTVAVSGLKFKKTKEQVLSLQPAGKTFAFTGDSGVNPTPAPVATFEFKPATTPAGEVCANTDGKTKNTKACGCKAKNAKEEEQTYPCTADQVCDKTATTAETACKATASNGSSLFLLAAFFLAMN